MQFSAFGFDPGHPYRRIVQQFYFSYLFQVHRFIFTHVGRSSILEYFYSIAIAHHNRDLTFMKLRNNIIIIKHKKKKLIETTLRYYILYYLYL